MDMEQLQQEIRSLGADAERLQQANRLVSEHDVLLLGIILFRANTERLQQTYQAEIMSLIADAQRLEVANRLAKQVSIA